MNIHHSQRGFTIIETLVAITILMISIVGPLTIANKGLLAAVYARDQVVASYLAQDAVEFIKNIRDNNVIQHEGNSGIDWLRGLSSCTSTDAVTNTCSIDTINGTPTNPTGTSFVAIAPCSGETCALYLKTTSCTGGAPYCGYSPSQTSATKSQFYRSFYVVPKTSGDQVEGSLAGSSAEASLFVKVWWKNGLVDNEVVYESELFNISH